MSGLPLISVETGLTQFDSYGPYRVRVDEVIPRCLEHLEGRRPHDAGLAIDRIRPHLRDEWAANLTRVLRQVPAGHGLRPVASQQAALDTYDERLAAFCAVDLREHEMALIRSLSPKTQARYLSLMIHHNPLVSRR
jgi:hypothetical protein